VRRNSIKIINLSFDVLMRTLALGATLGLVWGIITIQNHNEEKPVRRNDPIIEVGSGKYGSPIAIVRVDGKLKNVSIANVPTDEGVMEIKGSILHYEYYETNGSSRAIKITKE
jgi:hypothetical protein